MCKHRYSSCLTAHSLETIGQSPKVTFEDFIGGNKTRIKTGDMVDVVNLFLAQFIYAQSSVVVMCSGDIFYKIKEVDEQGWCTGVRCGCTGLYPENYAEVY